MFDLCDSRGSLLQLLLLGLHKLATTSHIYFYSFIRLQDWQATVVDLWTTWANANHMAGQPVNADHIIGFLETYEMERAKKPSLFGVPVTCL